MMYKRNFSNFKRPGRDWMSKQSCSASIKQGATSYTVSGDEAAQAVQFRRSQLPMRQLRLQDNFMEILSPNASHKACLDQPTCTWQILSPDRLSVESGVSSFLLPLQWNNVCSKLCKTLQGLLPDLWLFMLYVWLTKDSYRFFASAWINKSAHTLEPPPGLLDEYSKILDEVSPDLPAQLQALPVQLSHGSPT